MSTERNESHCGQKKKTDYERFNMLYFTSTRFYNIQLKLLNIQHDQIVPCGILIRINIKVFVSWKTKV